MGLSLKPLGKKIWEALTPQDEAAQRAGEASIAAAHQRLRTQNNVYGPMADPAKREQFIQQNQAPKFSLSQATRSSVADTFTKPEVYDRAPRVNVGNFKGSGLVEDFVNSPFRQVKGAVQVGQGRVKEGVGNVVAGTVEGPLGLLPVGRAAQAGVRVAGGVLPKVTAGARVGLREGAVYGGAYGAGDAASQNATPLDIAKGGVVGAAVGGAAGAVAGGAVPLAVAGAKQLPKVTAKVNDVAYTSSAEGRVNIGEQQVLQDFSDSLVGANKAQGRELSDLITQARAVGQKYGVDLTNGSVRDRLERANAILDTIGKQRQEFTQGGYIQLPERPKVTAKAPPARPSVGETQVTLPKVTAKTTKVKLNTDRLNLDAGYEGMKRLDKDTAEVINRMSNDEVVRLAKSAGMDTKTYTVEQTKKKIAEQLNVRRDAVRLQNEAEAARLRGDLEGAADLLKQSAERGRTSRTQGTDIARQLQARRIIANELDTPPQKVFKLLDNAGVNPDVYTKRFATVDFKNASEVAAAYRELVPAKAGDWIDALRYSSMLSSPLTHMVNTASNALNVGVVAPVEKTVRGVVDAAAGLFGKPRQYAAGEGAAYAAGAASKLREAASNFLDVMRGKGATQTADIDEFALPLAAGGAKGATSTALQFPTRLLGASDKFFRTLAGGGEERAIQLRQSKGIKLKGRKAPLIEGEAAYRVYQQDLGEKGQGMLLEGIDQVANAIQGLRKKNRVWGWVFPFVKTPTNLLKQGIEFSPAGLANLAGNADKVTALTRAAIGTATFGTAIAMLDAGEITWGEPIDPEDKAAFRAEGKQPYSIRVGDKWVSFTKLPPAVSFPFALVSGVDDAVKSKKMDETTADAIMEGVAKWGQFLSDQSYVKQIGDALKGVKGDAESVTQAFANYPQQLVPFRALTGWLARMTDPLDRKLNTDKGLIDRQVQALMLQYPGLRQKVDARENPFTGEPLEASNPMLNSVTPFRISDDKGYGDTTGYNLEQREMQGTMPKEDQAVFRQEVVASKNLTAQAKKEQAQFKKETGGGVTKLSNGKHYAKVGNDYRTFDTESDAKLAVAKYDFEQSGEKKKVVGDTYFYKTKDGDVKTKPKVLYEWEQKDAKNKLELDRAYEAGNLNKWLGLAEGQLEALEQKKSLYDPETEQDEIDKIILAQENLSQKAQGYIEKGIGGKGSKKTVGSAYKYAVSPTAGGGAVKPTVTAKRVGRVKSARGSARRAALPKVTVKKSLA